MNGTCRNLLDRLKEQEETKIDSFQTIPESEINLEDVPDLLLDSGLILLFSLRSNVTVKEKPSLFNPLLEDQKLISPPAAGAKF